MDLSNLFTVRDKEGNKYNFNVKKVGEDYKLSFPLELLKKSKIFYFFEDFTTVKANTPGYYIIPKNLDMMGDILITFKEREDNSFSFNRPWTNGFGIKTDKFVAWVEIERAYQYWFKVELKDNVYKLSVKLNFEDREDLYVQVDKPYRDVNMYVHIFPLDATYNDMASYLRNKWLKEDKIITLEEKANKYEAVNYASSHPLVRIRMGWKPSPSKIPTQTRENEPEMFVAATFSRVKQLAEELYKKGTKGVELQLVGWNISGHDGRYPEVLPADPRLGGNEGLKDLIDYVKSIGYRISLHTNCLDAYEIANNFSFDDMVISNNGKHLQCGHYSGGDAYHICPSKQKEIAKEYLDKIEEEFKPNGLHFSDVISLVMPDLCTSTIHPCSTLQAVEYEIDTMKYIKETMGGFSSEGGIDFSWKYLDYGLYLSFGTGFGAKPLPLIDRSVPLQELTIHGICLYNPLSDTINYIIKGKKERLYSILRGGRPSLYIYSKFRAAGEPDWMGQVDLRLDTDENFNKTVKAIKDSDDEFALFNDTQMTFMNSYNFLDSGLEEAIYSNGVKIVGNFTDEDKEYNGIVIKALDYKVFR